jgi:hypothetical protein
MNLRTTVLHASVPFFVFGLLLSFFELRKAFARRGGPDQLLDRGRMTANRKLPKSKQAKRGNGRSVACGLSVFSQFSSANLGLGRHFARRTFAVDGADSVSIAMPAQAAA